MTKQTFLPAAFAALGASLALASPALADASVPSVSGDVLLGVGAVVAAIIIWVVIRAALRISGNSGDGDDKAGVGILDGIDEDDDPKR